MARRKPKRRYRLIGFKAYFDTDQAIIEWWESLDEGSRSDAIRDLIHSALGLQPWPCPTAVPELPDLADLKHDTRWIMQTLDEMPGYLEQLVTQVVALQPVGGAAQIRAPAPDGPTLDDAESQRRARKLKRASW